MKIFSNNSSTIKPTIMIGLGGGGAEIAMNYYKGISEMDPEIKKNVFVKIFDTDTDDTNVGILKEKGYVYQIKYPPQLDHYLKNNFFNQPEKFTNWFPRFDRGEYAPFFNALFQKENNAKAAMQTRVLGKLAFRINFQNIYKEFQKLFSEIKNRQNDIRVFVASGLGGGTGSGMFLDMLALTRSFMNEIGNGKIAFIGTLNDILISKLNNAEKTTVAGNVYAALKELNHYQTKRNYQFEVPINMTTGISSKFPNDPSAPADYVFLVEAGNDKISFSNRTEQAKAISNMLLSMTVDSQLFFERQRNDLVDPIDVNGYHKIFSAFGWGSAILPKKSISEYISNSIFFNCLSEKIENDRDIDVLSAKDRRIEDVFIKLRNTKDNNIISSSLDDSTIPILDYGRIDFGLEENTIKEFTKKLMHNRVIDVVKEFMIEVETITNDIAEMEGDFSNNLLLGDFMEYIERMFIEFIPNQIKNNIPYKKILNEYRNLHKNFEYLINEMNISLPELRDKKSEAGNSLNSYALSIEDDFSGLDDTIALAFKDPRRIGEAEDLLSMMQDFFNKSIKHAMIHYIVENSSGIIQTVKKTEDCFDNVMNTIYQNKNKTDHKKASIENKANDERNYIYTFSEYINHMLDGVNEAIENEKETKRFSEYKVLKKQIVYELNEELLNEVEHYSQLLFKHKNIDFEKMTSSITEKINHQIDTTTESIKQNFVTYFKVLLLDENVDNQLHKWKQKLYDISEPLLESFDYHKPDSDFRCSVDWPKPLDSKIDEFFKIPTKWRINPYNEINLTHYNFHIGISAPNLKARRNYLFYKQLISTKPLHVQNLFEVSQMRELDPNFLATMRNPKKLLNAAINLRVVQDAKGTAFLKYKGETLVYYDNISETRHYKREMIEEKLKKEEKLYEDISKKVKEVLTQMEQSELYNHLVIEGRFKRSDYPEAIVEEINQKRDLELPNDWADEETMERFYKAVEAGEK